MTGFWYIIVSVGIILTWTFVLRGYRKLRRTTLTTAWVWSLLAATAWCATWFADQCASAISAALADHAWYACAVLSLCPPIAVLGSRRPGTRVWTWFILVPMLLALCWPIGALRLYGSELRRLQLETPQLLAFGLVLVMGVGNYCGTRFTLSALLFGGSVLSIVVSSSSASPGWLADRSTTRCWCTFVAVLSIGLMKMSPRTGTASRFDHLWFDFFDMFGIVWGRRIQDRVNYLMNKERLPARLELDGFVWLDRSNSANGSIPIVECGIQDGTTNSEFARMSAAEVEARIEHVLRWLMRRFVDPSWIDDRLGSNSKPSIQELAVDS